MKSAKNMLQTAKNTFRRARVDLAARDDAHKDDLMTRITELFAPFTMIEANKYLATLRLVERHKDVPGTVIECGTWKGGMIAGISMLLGDNRKYFLFDSFEGLPPAKEIDGNAPSGQSAIAWQANKAGRAYYDNCRADQEDAEHAMKLAGTTNYKVFKGWFENTLPTFDSDEAIAILRIDGDWYDSTIQCLDALFPRVVQGGLILIDDYYWWDGCTKAVHDYLSKYQRTEQIRQFDNSICYLKKR